MALAALAAALATVAGTSVADALDPYSAEDPDSESAIAAERLYRASGLDPDAGLIAVVETGADVESETARSKVERVADEIFRDASVGWVVTYYATGDRAMVSKDRRATYVLAHFGTLSDRAQLEGAERLSERLSSQPGVTVGGLAPANAEVVEIVSRDLVRAKLIAFPLLFLLSLWFFRGVVAALLPVLVGGLAIVAALAALRAASEAFSVSIFALNLVTGLGLGLAIDYGLLVVSRYREELAKVGPGAEALRRTLATAGRTVLFSSLTVAAALASLLVFPQRYLYSMGLGGLIVALVACVATLVVLPAVLALLGERVNALAPRRLRRAAGRDSRPASSGAWYRLSRLVMRRPAPIAVATAALLIALGIPFLGIRFTAVDASVLPASAEARQARAALDSRFPPNPTLPIYLAIEAPPGGEVDAFADRLGGRRHVAAVVAPRRVGDDRSVIEVVSGSGPLSDESQDLVRDIRSLPAPFEVAAGGRTADFVDQKASLADHLPVALAVLSLATLVALFLMTGSVVLPVKALAMNLLTISAAFGALVLIFQDGRLEGLLGYTSRGALDSSQPLLLFALAFGLSTDYGVFLLSRIKEAHDAGAPDREAVAIGLERTGRIVTAAALLLCVAIGVFATSQIVFLKELGVGTAAAVLIDATVVRALLVPSLMELLGRWNWWSPRPLRRLHARIVPGEGASAHGV